MNVNLRVLDDTHVDAFPLMLYLSSLPDGHWTRFVRATYNNPYCGPSRNAMNTGRGSRSTGVINHGDAPTTTNTCETWDTNNAQNTLAVWLRAAGIYTGHVGKWSNGYPFNKGDSYVPPGNDKPAGVSVGGWFAHLDDFGLGGVHNTAPFLHRPEFLNYALCENGVTNTYATGDSWTTTGSDASGRAITTTKYFTDRASLIFRDFMTAAGSRPWYFNLSERATHGVITVAARHQAGSGFSQPSPTVHLRPSFNQAAGADWNTMPAWVRAKALLTSPEIDVEKALQVDQFLAVQAVDESLRDGVTKQKALGIFDNTVTILMSDNGWLRGEHRLRKKNSYFGGSLNNEIWIRHPGAPLTNRTSTALVQNIDIAPTICEIMGARPSRPFVGQSFLKNVLTGDDSGWRDTAYVESYEVDDRQVPAFEGVVTTRYKYMEDAAFGAFAAEASLYDLDTHPDETRNVIGDSGYASVVTDMQRRLGVLRKAAAA